MGERNTISSSFSVNTIEDGKDGMVYEIVSSVGSVTIPSDASTATLSATLSFYRRQGTGARETYSCYYSVFRKNGTTYTKTRSVSTKSTTGSTGSMSLAAAGSGAANAADAVVVCIYDSYSESHSGYLAELEIPVRKNGDTGEQGEPGDDGQDAATLVFEPDVVFVPCDSDGMSTDAVNKSVAFFIEIKGTRYTPDSNTATAQVVGQDIDYTFSDNKTILNVDIGSGYSDIEGYIKVTATKTLNGVPYTASGCLSVVASMQGEPGPRGKMGPMSYLAGDYDDTVNYGALLTDTRCPVVHFVNGTTDEYWYPTENYKGAGYAPSVANGWQKADKFEMILTKVLFAQFAKLGGFVVSGDYMLSHYGELFDVDGNKLTLTEVTDENGFRSWQYDGVDAYTYFRDYDPMAEWPLPQLVRNNQTAASWNGWCVVGRSLTWSKNGLSNVEELDAIPVSGLFVFKGIVRDTNITKWIIFRCTKNIGDGGNITGTVVSYNQPNFRPAKLVNAVTGEEWMAGGKVHVTGDGDVTIEGTVKAKNLYHGVCVFIEGGIYSTQWYYVAGTSDWISSKGLSVGDYVEITDAMRAEAYFESTNLLPCTYDADIISMNPNGSANWGSSNDAKTVLLPDPKDFPGKIVEATSFNYGISAKTAYVGCVVENAFALKVAYNSTSKTVINDTGASVSSITISTGSLIRLLSIYASNQYWWLRIQ